METDFKPLVSIVIPVYNGSNYLKEAIDSALNQTYDNTEIIVVNDGSDDENRTRKIAMTFGEKIRYYEKDNGGTASALNFAIKNSTGEFISWLSHDDLYYPTKIERQIEEYRKFNKDLQINAVIFSHFEIYCMYNKKYKEAAKLDNYTSENPYNTFYMLDILFSSKLNGCTLLIPVKLFKAYGYFDESKKTIQDYILWFKFFNARVKFIYIPEPLVVSRHHSEQDTSKLLPLHLKELTYLYRWAFDLFKECFQKMPLWQFEHFLDLMKARNLDKVYAYMISEWANGDWNEDKPIIWLYWENKEGLNTPDSIRLCWKTMINHNKEHFRIKILTEDDVSIYLPKINPKYKLYKQIAHKADYIRFNLLYEYGGIWLDSDTIIFRSLKEVESLLKEFDFICTGYLHETNKVFPLIGFLASKPRSITCLQVIDRINKIINDEKFASKDQDWDFVGWELSGLLNSRDEKIFILPVSYFSPYRVFDGNEAEGFERVCEDATKIMFERNMFAYGQAVAYSVRSDLFKNESEVELLKNNYLIGSMFKLGYNIGSPLINNDIDDYRISRIKETFNVIISNKIVKEIIIFTYLFMRLVFCPFVYICKLFYKLKQKKL